MVFNNKFDYPFPVMIDYTPSSNQAPVISGQSIFNVTLAKLKSSQIMIFNMDILKK